IALNQAISESIRKNSFSRWGLRKSNAGNRSPRRAGVTPGTASSYVVAYQATECRRAERLQELGIGDASEKVGHVLGERAAAHEDHSFGLERRRACELGMKIHSGHPRHHDVAQDDVEAFPGPDQLQGLHGGKYRNDIVLFVQY